MADEPPVETGLPEVLGALCDGALEAIGVTGASVTVGNARAAGELMFASDDVAVALADMELTAGAGPGVDAVTQGNPVLVPDTTAGAVAGQMGAVAPTLRERAGQLGVGAVFAFPLQLGAVRLGVLHLYRTERGRLSEAGFRQSAALADRLTHALLGWGGTGATNPDLPDPKALMRAAVHQATGMVMVQLDITIEEAFARMRAHAFAEGVTIAQVADEVVTRRLRLAGHEEDR